MKRFHLISLFIAVIFCNCTYKNEPERPNILFAISDDQSFAHTSFAGAKFVHTPAFDRIAQEGIYFSNCIAGSPGCAPSRSAIVTGRHHWQNEQAGQHASSWLKKYVSFVDLLLANGYAAGLTGKGVNPFRYAESEADSLWRKENAGGISYSHIKYEAKDGSDERTATEISTTNYFQNFKYFVENIRKDKPFFFWYGAFEPHRPYEQDSYKRNRKQLSDIKEFIDFFPDNDIVRGDILDYAVEIEWFDLHLQRMLSYLEEIDELENTIVIVTADNGMPFPRAKANGYEYGIHVPMAIRYPKGFKGGRVIDDPIGFIDLAPTLLDITQTKSKGMMPITGKSLLNILESELEGTVDSSRKFAFSGRERHSSSRYRNYGYPQRMIRSKNYLYIWNMKPERWPAGAPQRIIPNRNKELYPMNGIDENGKHHSEWAFTDIDAAPTKSVIVEQHHKPGMRKYFDWSVAKRPEVEFFDIINDPYCINNLAGNKAYEDIEEEMREALMTELIQSEDPRVVGPDKDIFDSYIRYSRLREFPKPE